MPDGELPRREQIDSLTPPPPKKEQNATKMKEPADAKSKVGERRGKKFHGFKKKGSRNKGRKRQSTTAGDFFRGVGFSVGREGPEMYS